ncbi:MAG TPA: TetR family transcriptional regulator [Bdellovibrio sp.]
MARTKKVSDSEVLDRAFEVISREGFHSFTFAQVGKAVQLSPAALVKRFKTKKHLATLARNQRWDRNLGHVAPEELQKLHGLSGLFEFLGIISRSVDSKKLGEHAVWLGTEACHHKSRKKVATYFAETRKIIFQLLCEAIAAGDVSPKMDVKASSVALEALIQGAIFQFAFMDEKNIEAHLKSHFKVLLQPWLLR